MAFVLFAAQPLLVGCGGLDFSLKDAEWFSRPTMFSRSLTLETPPLSDGRPVSAADLISAEGYCAGMASPADANALTEHAVRGRSRFRAAPASPSAAPSARSRARQARPTTSRFRLKAAGAMTMLTYVRGPRPGIYRFADGRMIVDGARRRA